MVVISPDGTTTRARSLKIDGPSELIFNPAGFRFGDGMIRLWIETEATLR